MEGVRAPRISTPGVREKTCRESSDACFVVQGSEPLTFEELERGFDVHRLWSMSQRSEFTVLKLRVEGTRAPRQWIFREGARRSLLLLHYSQALESSDAQFR